jgi:PST family polysaccharide transporter
MFRPVAQANAILLVQYGVGSLVPFLLLPHIVRSIGLEAYGHLAVALAWAGYGSLVVQYAFHLTGPQRVAQAAGDGDATAAAFAEVSSAKALLLLCIVPVMGVVGWWALPGRASGEPFWLLLLLLPLANALNSAWFLQAQGRFLLVCGIAIAGSLLTLAIGFGLVRGADATSMLAAAAASASGALVLGLASVHASSRSVRMRWPLLRHARPWATLRQEWTLFTSQFVSALYTASGPIVIYQLLGSTAAGSYSAVDRIVTALTAACLLTHAAAYPRLATAYAHDRPAYWRLLKMVVLAYLAVSAGIACAVWLLRVPLAGYLFGRAPEGSNALLGWGLAWLVVSIVGPALTGYLTFSGQHREIARLSVYVLVSTWAVGLWAVSAFGPAGWMAALVLSQSLIVYKAIQHWRLAHAR